MSGLFNRMHTRLSECQPNRPAYSFRNIRYAKAERFGPAELTPLEHLDPGAARGPVPPQLPSRLAIALGPQANLVQNEQCQVLSIHTLETTGARPVLIWFHGGAHVSGGGELPWYDGARFAQEQNVVVVSVSSRLGVLGYYYEEQHHGPSPAMTDQLAAIEWVHRHIRDFGGDPNRITLAGQSAGAMSIEVMLRWGLGPHVVGAIFQSGNLRDPAVTYSESSAREHSRKFDLVRGGRALRDASVDELLTAQNDFVQVMGDVTWGPVRPENEAPITVAALGGWTINDDLPFTMISHGLERLNWADREALEAQVQADTTSLYIDPTLMTLSEAAEQGARSWAYRFTWAVPGSPWGSPHCMELPFLFGDREAWHLAPMLVGADWEVIHEVGRSVRLAWADFMHTSNPGSGWTEWSAQSGVINDIPEEVEYLAESKAPHRHGRDRS